MKIFASRDIKNLLIVSLRRKIQTFKEELEEKETGEGKALDFYLAKQDVLGSYFQFANLMILKRINGLHNDNLIEQQDSEMNVEFNLEKDESFWGKEG